MFYVFTILAVTILIYESYNLWKAKPREWSALITVFFLTIGAITYTAIYEFELIKMSPLVKLGNTLLKSLLPGFYDFMEV
ncbi:MAG: hypothetical protein GX923_00630 [Clostridia bacterium]|jgi:hypothetical protein|nr:hypothetical protein [Clostridia bacterium]